MRQKTHILLILIAVTALPATAQYLDLTRLVTPQAKQNRLLLNVDRLWSYNLYEHSRWGFGLRHQYSFARQSACSLLTTDAYFGYGTYDRRAKGGLRTELTLRGRAMTTLYAEAAHDLAASASRSMATYSLTQVEYLSSFTNSYYDEVTRLGVGLTLKATRQLTLGAEARLSYEVPLFVRNADYAIRYYRTDGYTAADLGSERYAEVRLQASTTWGLRAELLTGYAAESRQPVARLLAQYGRSVSLRPFSLGLFAQGGYSLRPHDKAPLYSRLFDLGGNNAVHFLFRNTLLTATPAEALADRFLLGMARLDLQKPLFRLNWRLLSVGTAPAPFVQASLAAGALDGFEGRYPANSTLAESLYDMPAHRFAILEGVAGADGLVTWGLTSWGVAWAVGLWPAAEVRSTWLLTARLDL